MDSTVVYKKRMIGCRSLGKKASYGEYTHDGPTQNGGAAVFIVTLKT